MSAPTAALLGGAPVFIPAPQWLRGQTLDRVQLTSAGSALPEPTAAAAVAPRRAGPRVGLLVGVPPAR